MLTAVTHLLKIERRSNETRTSRYPFRIFCRGISIHFGEQGFMISRKELKKHLNYNPDTGIFTWKIRKGRQGPGDIAGTLTSNGYISICIGKIYRHLSAHRIAFLYMTGSIPEFVDHIDRNKSNNKWSNLRKATKSQNSGNTNIMSTNTSGYKGVSYRKTGKRIKRWYAQIRIKDKPTFLGYFLTKEEAAVAYDNAAIKTYGEFANLNFKEIK